MAAGTFKVETSRLKSTANSFNNTGNQIKSTTSQMMSIVNSLSGTVWSGDAASKYKKQFGQLQDDINKIVKMINEQVTDLNEMARGYEEAEKQNASMAASLRGDVIV